jgi:hypothetical protein
LRGDVRAEPVADVNSPDDPAWKAYEKNTTFRSAVVCPACYKVLDSEDGTGEINGRCYGLAGKSRGDRAPVYTEAKYRAYKRRLAGRMGIDQE